ncbi:MAG: 4Fe-4S binding protein [Dehalococcoidales bacterium]|nr:4Fe-4S binding protein [Dehalococcoidales bacterium]
MDNVFARLRAALDRLPGGFPATKSGVELEILRRIFPEADARLAAAMTGMPESATAIATRAGTEPDAALTALKAMARRGLVWPSRKDGDMRFRLAPWVIGIYEEQWDKMDHELAHLCDHYWQEGGMEGIMKLQPALHRVIPHHGSVKTEEILPYDDVRSLLLQSKSFGVRECICRKQHNLTHTEKCKFPTNNCLNFSASERLNDPHAITQTDALRILDEAEKVGLVHTVSNNQRGVGYVCNCCGCCCNILGGITKLGIAKSVAVANYLAVVSIDSCTSCGICAERCQVAAVKVDNTASVDRARCIGCGLCVTGCPSDAIHLQRKPEAEIVHPPDNYRAWEEARLKGRGLA